MKGLKKLLIGFVAVVFICSVGICYGSGLIAKHGSRGDKVAEIQTMLQAVKMYRGEIDGEFGPQTQAAVQKFQKRYHKASTGQVNKTLFNLMCQKSEMNFNNYRKKWVMESTAYSPHDPGVNGRTATGTSLRKGIIAVDPVIIPLGTKVYVMGYGYGLAADTGGAIKGNIIDVAFNSHGEALRWGRRYVRVYFF